MSSGRSSSPDRAAQLELRRANSCVTLAPALGGTVTRYDWHGRQVMRPAHSAAADPREMSCFPLVPVVNRIAHGRFTFDGEQISLEPNIAREKHPLHGDGWTAAWRVVAADAARATLQFTHEAGAWPWSYTAEQSFELAEDALRVELAATNRDTRPMPVGLGFHPYFLNDGRTRLQAQVREVWLTNDEQLPIGVADGDFFASFRSGDLVARAQPLDHCYTRWAGPARIDIPGEELTVRLTASAALGCLHVYSPPGLGYCCIEPVSHMPNALNQPDPAAAGLRVLGPGEVFRVWMNLAVAPLA